MKLVRLINQHAKDHLGMILAVVVLQLGAVAAMLWLPSLNARIIDEGVLQRDLGLVWRNGGIMLAVSALQVFCQISAVNLGARVAMGMGADIRSRLFSRVLSFSNRELNQFGAPSLITRNTNDVQQVQMLVLMTLIMMITAPMTMVGGVVMALREDAQLSWLILVAVVVLAVFLGILVSIAMPQFGRMQTAIDTLNRVVREQVTGIRVVRAFAREDHESRRFDEANTELMNVGIFIGRLMALLFPLMFLVMNTSQAAVIWFAHSRIDEGAMQVGQLLSLIHI